MENNFQEFIAETRRWFRDYIEARWRLIRLDAAGKLSKALGLFFTLTMAFLLFFFVIVFLGMVLAYWISEMSGSFTLGFSVTAFLFIVLLGILLIFRKRLIQRPLANLLIRELVEEIDEADEERETDQI